MFKKIEITTEIRIFLPKTTFFAQTTPFWDQCIYWAGFNTSNAKNFYVPNDMDIG